MNDSPGMVQALEPDALLIEGDEADEVGFPTFSCRQQEVSERAALVRIVGERMRQARELCNLSQSAAAKLLGYRNSSKLSKVEGATDTNSVPLWLLPRAAKLYGVTVGFLLGVEEADTTQSAAILRASNLWLADALEKARQRDLVAIEGVRSIAMVAVKYTEELAAVSMATQEAMESFVQRNKRKFEGAPASATLAFRIDELTSLAQSARSALRRMGLATVPRPSTL